jgi:hypothetical protein
MRLAVLAYPILGFQHCSPACPSWLPSSFPLPPSLKTAGTWCDAHSGPFRCRETPRNRVLSQPVQPLKLTLVQIEHRPGPLHVDPSNRRGRALQRDQAADRHDHDRRRGRAGSERGREDHVEPRATARWLKRDRGRLDRDGAQRLRQPGDAVLERPTVVATREMGLEQNELELRELGVHSQRQLLTGPRAVSGQDRTHSHPPVRRPERRRG